MLVDYKGQYGLNVPGRSEIGNLDLDNRVPLYEQGLGGPVKTEESRTVAIDADGKILPDGSETADHQLYMNIPTVVEGTKYSDKDADMHYMLTGQHLGKFNKGVQSAVDDARRVHIRQMNSGKEGLIPKELQMEIDFLLGH